jgi:hypothetical protein
MDWRDGGVAYGAEECCLARPTSPEKQKGRKTKTAGLTRHYKTRPASEGGCYKNEHAVEKDD